MLLPSKRFQIFLPASFFCLIKNEKKKRKGKGQKFWNDDWHLAFAFAFEEIPDIFARFFALFWKKTRRKKEKEKVKNSGMTIGCFLTFRKAI